MKILVDISTQMWYNETLIIEMNPNERSHLMAVSRNETMYWIERRITTLLEIMKAAEGLTSEGLPKSENGTVFEEWNLLRDVSTKLQGLEKETQF
jgi:hypothetical protein